MSILKSHKSVDKIAKKHNVTVNFIVKQLDLGIPIEHEHTKDKELATNIALQHLWEIPDYYTRLKKLETSAKKVQNVKEHCGCEDKAVKDLENGLKKLNDISYNTIDKLMRRIMKKYDMTAKQLHNSFVSIHDQTPDDWIKNLKEGTLHHWFKGSKSKDGKPGWVQADGSPCANEPGETSTPKCFSRGRLNRLKRTKKGRAIIRSAVRRKRKQDPNQQDKTGASSPTYVKTFAKGKKDPLYVKAEPKLKESMDIQEAQKDKPGKGSGKKDACYYKVKSRFRVWPSAYGSASLVRCRKAGAKNWGTKTEATMHEEQRYCPLCDKRETRSECSYGGNAWDKVSIKDHEYSMARSELKTIENAVKKLKAKVGKGEGDLEAWVQSKITKAADYIDTAADYVMGGEMEESISFEVDPKDIRNSNRSSKIRNLSMQGATKGERSAAESKRKGPKMPLVKTGDTHIRNINAGYELPLVDKILSELEEDGPCWKGYKRKKGTVKYKKGSCVKAENVTIEDANGNTFAEVIDIIKPEPIKGFKSQVAEATRLQAQTGNVLEITLSWRGKYYSLKMFFPQVKLPTRKEINHEIQKVYPGSRVIHHIVSAIQPGQPLIQVNGSHGGNSGKIGPDKNYVKPMSEDVEFNEDWQSINRKDNVDGLSQSAVNAYRRENPGSRLQTAVTEKKPKGKRKKRRKAFCKRMKGMRSKLTSSKTARDPNSRINKALRRWKCR